MMRELIIDHGAGMRPLIYEMLVVTGKRSIRAGIVAPQEEVETMTRGLVINAQALEKFADEGPPKIDMGTTHPGS